VLQALIAEAISQFNLAPATVSVKGQTGCDCVFDQRAMKIVVNNLFDNAIKYSEKPVR
jgi:signal transduction histidine kinase